MEPKTANSSPVTPSREQIFADFHARTGGQPFAPDFKVSLWKVMRDRNAGLAARTWAWVRWRASGNHSLCPVTDWNPAYAKKLGQIDCAVDLAWLEEGQTIEWVENASADLRAAKAAAINWKNHKSGYSHAFAENQRCGLLDIQGHTIYVCTSAPAGDPAKSCSKRATCNKNHFSLDKQFLEWWKVAQPENFRAWEEAEAARREAREVAQNSYREWLDQATPAGPSLYVNTDKNSGSEDSSIVPKVESSSSSGRGPEEEEDFPLPTESEPEPEPIPEPAFDAAAGFAELQAEYPPGRIDVAASRAAYRDTVKTAAEHTRLMEGLRRHKVSERWQRSLAETGGRFIPMCSKFIRAQQYADSPPPFLDLIDGKSMKRQEHDRRLNELIRQEEQRRARIAAAGGKP